MSQAKDWVTTSREVFRNTLESRLGHWLVNRLDLKTAERPSFTFRSYKNFPENFGTSEAA